MRKYVEQQFYAVEESEREYIAGCVETYKAVEEHCQADMAEDVLKQMHDNIRKRFDLPDKLFFIGAIGAKVKCESCGEEKDVEVYVINMIDVKPDGNSYPIQFDDDKHPYIEFPDEE